MGAMMKGDQDLLTLQIKCSGPIQGLTVTADAKGNVKGFVENPEVMLPPNSKGKLDVGGALDLGILTVIKDMGLKEPYSGQTELKTGEIAEDIGSSDAEALVGAVKDTIVAEGITDEDGINQAIDDAAKKLDITLSDEDKAKINDVMQKVGDLDLNADDLKEQAKQLYDKLGELNVSKEQVQGWFSKLLAWLKQLLS